VGLFDYVNETYDSIKKQLDDYQLFKNSSPACSQLWGIINNMDINHHSVVVVTNINGINIH
jgi:hypothetical protein